MYDEPGIVQRLASTTKPSRVMFAAACAERLQPLYRRFHDASGQGDPGLLHAALDAVWQSVVTGSRDPELPRWQQAAEELVPDDEDDDWVDESAYAQNGAAAVAYAVRTALTDDPQQAGWAARQVYEAADYAAQRQQPDLDPNAPDFEAVVLAQPVVQEALNALAADLAAAERGEVVTSLRQRAREGGERLAELAGLR